MTTAKIPSFRVGFYLKRARVGSVQISQGILARSFIVKTHGLIGGPGPIIFPFPMLVRRGLYSKLIASGWFIRSSEHI
jgi:hypothetical protein